MMKPTNAEVRVVRHGTWKYDAAVTAHVWVTRQAWDYYHEEAFDSDPPDLNGDGEAYYVLYGLSSRLEEASSRSRTLLSVDEAVSEATRLLGTIDWV